MLLLFIHYTKSLLSLGLRAALIYRQGDKNSGDSLILCPYASKFYVNLIKAGGILKRKTLTEKMPPDCLKTTNLWDTILIND